MSRKNNARKNNATDEQLEKVSGGTYTVLEQENGKYCVWDKDNDCLYQENIDTEYEACSIAENLNLEEECGYCGYY